MKPPLGNLPRRGIGSLVYTAPWRHGFSANTLFFGQAPGKMLKGLDQTCPPLIHQKGETGMAHFPYVGID